MRPGTRGKKNRRTRVYAKKRLRKTRRKRCRGGVGEKRKRDPSDLEHWQQKLASLEQERKVLKQELQRQQHPEANELFEDLLRAYIKGKANESRRQVRDNRVTAADWKEFQRVMLEKRLFDTT